jgi:hypothetical protein
MILRNAPCITAELIASGLNPAQTTLLMELVLSMSTGLSTGQGGENRALEKRRAWDRNRQALKREAEKEAKRLSALSTGHPPESTGFPPENADVRSNEGNKNRSLQEEKEDLKKVSKKGSRLLIGARLSDENRTVAIECGCPPDKADKVWTEFVDYWSDIPGQKGCKLSWTGTWRNRVKFIFERTSNGHAKPKSAIIQAADDLCRKIAEFDGPPRDRDEIRSGEGQNPPRLLSYR